MASMLGKPPSTQPLQISRSDTSSPSPSITLQRVVTTKRALSPERKRKISTDHSRRSSIGGITEGIGNLNRWSQSTVSSKSSVATHQRRNSFARRLSGSFGSLSAFTSSQSPPSPKHLLKKSNPLLNNSLQRSAPRSPPAYPSRHLPPLVTLPSLSQAVDAAKTPLTPATITPTTADLLPSAMYSGKPIDYFGDKWKTGSPSKQQVQPERQKVVSSSAGSPTAKRHSGGTQGLYSQAQPVTSVGSRIRQSKSNTEIKENALGTRSNHSRHRIERHRSSDHVDDFKGSSPLRNSPSESGRRRKPPSQKAMLSKALQKANHAVLLDNAQNFEGAMDAYGDACDLLQQVMVRSSGDEDRRKLETIRTTYRDRIKELQSNELQPITIDDKALPEVPSGSDSNNIEPFSPITDDDDDSMAVIEPARVAVIEPARVAQMGQDFSKVPESPLQRSLPREQLPPRRQSLMPFATQEDGVSTPVISVEKKQDLFNSWSVESSQGDSVESKLNLATPMCKEYMPPPLSPRRPLSPWVIDPINQARSVPFSNGGVEPKKLQHSRQETAESTSWLDTIDESGSSSASSIHSQSSSMGLHRKHIRAPSGATEVAFATAFDAALEAVYDDSAELMDSQEEVVGVVQPLGYSPDIRRNVESAKEAVREAERQAMIAASRNTEKQRLLGSGIFQMGSDYADPDYNNDEVEEEERILEEMTRDYIMDDTDYDVRSKSALPRQSDSSGFSGRTWGSSIGSNPTTAGTSLTTVVETSVLSMLRNQLQATQLPPSYPPPLGALPPPPHTSATLVPIISAIRPMSRNISPDITPGVRDRRLSGQKARELKIDTSARLPAEMTAPKTQPVATLSSSTAAQAVGDISKSASLFGVTHQALIDTGLNPLVGGGRNASSPIPSRSPLDPLSGTSFTTLALPPSTPNGKIDHGHASVNSPTRTSNATASTPRLLRKNFSSSSLKSMKLSLSASNVSVETPNTPMTKVPSLLLQLRPNDPRPALPELSTPIVTNFNARNLLCEQLSILQTDTHSPSTPGTPNPLRADGPLPLESCPDSILQRPFWLLRSIYYAITNSKGGYVSSRLFLPRDIWKVRNVKLKGLEEKASNLDLLTAALLKLSKVDKLDADVVLEEMQSFELILDAVQAQLTKKLGGEVGAHGSMAMFRGSSVGDEAGTQNGKSYLLGLRKLRSKNSSGPSVHIGISSLMNNNSGSREALTMRSLPITSIPVQRYTKRDVIKVQGFGPYSNYMMALARLCDASQVLDQIARQVEDPGLKHSSQTHVGLELSTRHAAEFFAFYVCRFVLTDIGMLLDKYIKRGSDSVLS